MFHLTMHSAHFIFGYMALDVWLRTTQIVREETHCCFYYTNRGALAGMRNTPMGIP